MELMPSQRNDRSTPRRLKVWSRIHTWTSLLCTPILVFLCVTGLPLIFRDEIAVWSGDAVQPRDMAAGAPRVSLDHLVRVAQDLRPKEFIRLVTWDRTGLTWSVAVATSPAAKQDSTVFTFDAHTGDLLGERTSRKGVMPIITKLHEELLVGLPGMVVLGVVGALFLVSVVSGVMVYGPFMRKLPFGAVRWDRSAGLVSLDLHNLLGVATVLWALVVGTTGVINTGTKPLVKEWQATELAAMIAPWRDQPVLPASYPLQGVVDTTRAAAPDMDVAWVAFPGTARAGPQHYAVLMRGNTAVTSRLLTLFLIEADTGRLTERRTLPWYVRALRMSQTVHFIDYGGLPLKIIWALLDGITIVVLVGGVHLWWRKRTLAIDPMWADAGSAASQ